MLPFMCFKMEPSENKFHHQGLSYTKLCGGVCMCARAAQECVCVCMSRFRRSHLQRIWPYGRQHIYPERERAREADREGAKEGVCEKESVVFCQRRKGILKHILYPYLRSDGSDKKEKKKNPPSHPLLHIFVEWENLSQLTHLHWAMMDSK